jgi:hypothetical protein
MQAIKDALGKWSQQTLGHFDFPQWSGALLIAEILLYKGDPIAALKFLEENWRSIMRLLRWVRSPYLRILAFHSMARCVIAIAAMPGCSLSDRSDRLRDARRLASRIEKEATQHSVAISTMVHASICAVTQDRQRGLTILTNAEASLQFVDMHMYEAAVRWRRGQLIGGDEGQRLRSSSEEFMRSQAVERPDRITDMLVPGTWE